MAPGTATARHVPMLGPVSILACAPCGKRTKSAPATLVVLRDGRVVDRVVGVVPKPDLTVRLTPHLLRRN